MSFWVSLVDAVAVLVIAKLVWIAVRVPVLRFAAERGSVRAQLALGNMYGSGKGVAAPGKVWIRITMRP